jgi:hypothetical protein
MCLDGVIESRVMAAMLRQRDRQARTNRADPGRPPPAKPVKRTVKLEIRSI